MKFISYKYKGEGGYGVFKSDKGLVYPLKNVLKLLYDKTPETLAEFIEIVDDDTIEFIRERILQKDGLIALGIEDIKLCAPIIHPRRNIICIGKNYIEHAKESKHVGAKKNVIPKYPIVFTKMASEIIGHGVDIYSHPDVTNQIDYEVELAIVIGKQGKNIKEEDALDYIFGYTIANDISARDVQIRHEQWLLGKSLDTFSVMGPALVYKDEIDYPVNLNLTCKINGETRQSSSTKNMIFNIGQLISVLSQGITLMPGDIILTGTPEGVGLGFNPPKYLASGDIVECSIDKLGILKNKIV